MNPISGVYSGEGVQRDRPTVERRLGAAAGVPAAVPGLQRAISAASNASDPCDVDGEQVHADDCTCVFRASVGVLCSLGGGGGDGAGGGAVAARPQHSGRRVGGKLRLSGVLWFSVECVCLRCVDGVVDVCVCCVCLC